MSSRTVRATQRNPDSNKQRSKQKRGKHSMSFSQTFTGHENLQKRSFRALWELKSCICMSVHVCMQRVCMLRVRMLHCACCMCAHCVCECCVCMHAACVHVACASAGGGQRKTPSVLLCPSQLCSFLSGFLSEPGAKRRPASSLDA